MATPYKRILLKLSGESLKGDQPGIFDDERLMSGWCNTPNRLRKYATWACKWASSSAEATSSAD